MLRGWLEERTGWPSALGRILCEPIEGGARFSHVFGSVLLFLFVLQAVTGALLACNYSPSTSAAWASVAFIQDQVRLGWLVRGLHAMGASAIVVVAVMHLLQVAIAGAYRKPREITWLVGIALLALALAFALTGNLLPWDQKGYWTTQVVTSLIGALPFAGRGLARLLVGGEGYGNLTLTRSYALHVLVLPALGLALILAHVTLFRRHGVTPPWSSTSSSRPKTSEPFWPRQAARDLAAMLLALGIMTALVAARHGVSIEAPADPSSAYAARPEWYFRSLFFVIKLLPARHEVAGATLAPLAVLAFFLALPFLDRGSSRQLRARWPWIAVMGAVLVGIVAFGFASWVGDARTPAYRAERRKVDEQSRRARALALAGVPSAGGLAVYENDPEIAGRRVFAGRCAACHELGGVGERSAPRLDGWATRRWTIGVIRDPDSAENYGTSGVSGMKPLAAPGDVLAAIAEYLFAQGSGGQVDTPKRARGEIEFARQECNKCHLMDGHAAGDGPNLGGWGSFAWARAFLLDPGAARFYGKQNRMPRMAERLSDEDLDALAHLLAGQRLADK